MKRFLPNLLLIPLLGLTLSAFAQSSEQRLSLDPFISLTHYSGDLGSEYEYFEQKDINPGFGIAANLYISPFVDLGTEFAYNRLDYSSSEGNFDSEIYTFSILGKMKVANGALLPEDAAIAPYIIAGPGIGYAQIEANTNEDGAMDNDLRYLSISMGAGSRFRITKNLSAFAQLLFVKPTKDMIDGASGPVNGRDSYLQSSAGMVFKLGNVEDSDGDGVIDKHDKCPGTSALAKVTPEGCPVDSDNDGIADYLDKCAMMAGPKATDGCPDADEDGVIDSQDACPDAAGTALMFGCPDSDNDGVADNIDRCPDEAGSRFNMGCAATVDSLSVSPMLVQQMGFAAKDITFETDKAIIRASSEAALSDVVKVLNQNPKLSLTIEGHTDNTGTTEHNMQLSKDRANAVLNYLAEAGIETSRLAAIGYGETRPIAENDNETGRAENRRVILILHPSK